MPCLVRGPVDLLKLLGVLSNFFAVESSPGCACLHVSGHSIKSELGVENVVFLPPIKFLLGDPLWVLSILGNKFSVSSLLLLKLSGVVPCVDQGSSSTLVGNHLGLPGQLLWSSGGSSHFLVSIICLGIICKLGHSFLNLWGFKFHGTSWTCRVTGTNLRLALYESLVG